MQRRLASMFRHGGGVVHWMRHMRLQWGPGRGVHTSGEAAVDGGMAPLSVSALRVRGMVRDTTDEEALDEALGGGSVSVYAGFDPTAPSLHLGNLVQLLALRRLQQHGHRPIVLLGGATALLGDPSGRATERTLMGEGEVADNLSRIHASLGRVLDLEATTVVNNADWYRDMSALAFLRDLGKHMRVSSMLAREAVSSRLATDAGISYTELSYQILQAYDYVHLHKTHGCTLQIGGSDQWGNITAGIQLAHKMSGVRLHGLTLPLLTTASGEKFGKSAGNAVWIDGPPFGVYQYLVRCSDDDVAHLLRVLTLIDEKEIGEVMAAHGEAPHRRLAQHTLADDLTRMLHGDEGLAQAKTLTQALYGGGSVAAALEALPKEDVVALCESGAVPGGAAGARDVVGARVVDVAVMAGVASSKSEAKRVIKAGGMQLNGVRVGGVEDCVGDSDLVHGVCVCVKSGKRRVGVVHIAR